MSSDGCREQRKRFRNNRMNPGPRADLLDTKECWGTLALADGKILICDQKQMKCVVLR